MRLDEFCSFMEEYLDEAPKFNLANPVRTTQSGWVVMQNPKNPARPNRVDSKRPRNVADNSRKAYDKVDTTKTGYTKPGYARNSDDNFLYHTTPEKNVKSIEKHGIEPQYSGNYSANSKGKAFVSDHISNHTMQQDLTVHDGEGGGFGRADRKGMAVLRIPRRAVDQSGLQPDHAAMKGNYYDTKTIKGSDVAFDKNPTGYNRIKHIKKDMFGKPYDSEDPDNFNP